MDGYGILPATSGLPAYHPEVKREPGVNPGLPRSGKQERKLSSSTGE